MFLFSFRSVSVSQSSLVLLLSSLTIPFLPLPSDSVYVSIVIRPSSSAYFGRFVLLLSSLLFSLALPAFDLSAFKCFLPFTHIHLFRSLFSPPLFQEEWPRLVPPRPRPTSLSATAVPNSRRITTLLSSTRRLHLLKPLRPPRLFRPTQLALLETHFRSP